MQPDAKKHIEQRLLLFMSVDLAGSTAFKSKTVTEKIQPWLKVFVDFYHEFPTKLRGQYLAGKPDSKNPLKSPEMWKAIGDELVFVAKIGNGGEVPEHLRHFRETVRYYREIVQDVDAKLDLKATAWIAGFPVYNSAIFLPETEQNGSKREDYIGPSIDTGFRLGKVATSRRFVISVELAYLLASLQATTKHLNEFDFYYDGGVELKGVLSGFPYPVIWTDLHNPSELELSLIHI